MGCSSNKQGNYVDYDNEEESELRRFEVEIGGLKRNLNQVVPTICIEKDIIPIAFLEDFILQDFSENFVNLIRQGYFYKEVNGVNYYDAKKVSLLLYLLTNDAVVDNGKLVYHDKASFLFTFIKTKTEQDLTAGVEANDEFFLSFIEDLVEISLEGIVNCYITLKNVNRDGELKKLKNIKTLVVKSIVDNLFFTKNEQASKLLSFVDLNKKFEGDRFIFTSGYIREYAWDLVKSGKAAEFEKQKEDEFQTANEPKVDEKK